MATKQQIKFNLIDMEVIQQSFQLYRKGFWSCLPISLMIAIGINAPFLFFDYTSPLDFLSELFAWQGYKSALMIFIWLVTFIALESLIVHLNNLKSEKTPSLSDCLSVAITEFFPLVLVGLLYSIIVICGIVFLIVPGIILTVSLMFSFILRLLEPHDIFESLVISHRLVWGRWWYTVMIISIPVLINLCVFLAVYISTIGILTQFSATWEHAHFFAFLLNSILQILFIPFIFSTVLTLFYDLKSKDI